MPGQESNPRITRKAGVRDPAHPALSLPDRRHAPHTLKILQIRR